MTWAGNRQQATEQQSNRQQSNEDRMSRCSVALFVFPELQPRLVLRRCEYREAEVSIAAEATTCPRQVERKSLSGGDAYKMDEEH